MDELKTCNLRISYASISRKPDIASIKDKMKDSLIIFNREGWMLCLSSNLFLSASSNGVIMGL